MQQSAVDQLRAWIRKRFRTNVEAAEYLGIPGIDDVVLNKILNAGRRPELEKLVIIEEKTGIPLRAWASSQVDERDVVGSVKSRKPR